MSSHSLRNAFFPKRDYADKQNRPKIDETAFWVTAKERLTKEQYLVLKLYYKDGEELLSVAHQIGIEVAQAVAYMNSAIRDMKHLESRWIIRRKSKRDE